MEPTRTHLLLSTGIDPDSVDWDLLAGFEAGLYEWNQRVNLTRVPRERFFVRHVVDSLLFQDLIPSGSRVLDLGTGPGFPAWPLAWARQDLHVTALDSSGKPLAFLRSQALPNLEVLQGRAEELGVSESFDVVTGRALAPLAIQLELSASPCAVGGWVLPLRTASDVSAIEAFDPRVLGLELVRIERRTLPIEEAARVCPIYRKIQKTPTGYPRPWAEIRKRPLGSST